MFYNPSRKAFGDGFSAEVSWNKKQRKSQTDMLEEWKFNIYFDDDATIQRKTFSPAQQRPPEKLCWWNGSYSGRKKKLFQLLAPLLRANLNIFCLDLSRTRERKFAIHIVKIMEACRRAVHVFAAEACWGDCFNKKSSLWHFVKLFPAAFSHELLQLPAQRQKLLQRTFLPLECCRNWIQHEKYIWGNAFRITLHCCSSRRRNTQKSILLSTLSPRRCAEKKPFGAFLPSKRE